MTVTHHYLSKITSKGFNDRYADIYGGSLLSGFYFEQGTDPLSITISAQQDPSSVLVFSNGVRIEEKYPIENAITLADNITTKVRKDWIYIVYEYGRYETTVNFEVLSSNDEPYVNKDMYMLLGLIIVPPNASGLVDCAIEYVNRGLHLQDVAKDITFKGTVSLLEDPIDSRHVTTKQYVDERTNQKYHRSEASRYNSALRLFEEVRFYRPDNTLALITNIEEVSKGKPTKISCSVIDEKGVSEIDNYKWILEYDSENRMINKYRT